MRTMFIHCKTRRTAVKYAPWASFIVKVDGGFCAFESTDDYRVWRNQR